ncbi:hypothetical protein BDW59DRAFT_141949 [Aspergillus cavernicola]|uniref:Secreted protein n=1 Tax=Aspergillus cavernicola TaxID=176166 RepID=A0ABR4ISI1_9EURO
MTVAFCLVRVFVSVSRLERAQRRQRLFKKRVFRSGCVGICSRRGNNALDPGRILCDFLRHQNAVMSAWGSAYVTVFSRNNPDLLPGSLTIWAADTGHSHGIPAF